jgi:hypothetical protein
LEGTSLLQTRIEKHKPVEEASMLKKISGAGLIVLVGALVIGTVAVWALPSSAEAAYGGGRGAARRPSAAEPVRSAPVVDDIAGDLTESEVDALLMALDDEYKAWSVYEQVIADFGEVRPFTSIQKAEENHIAALVTLFDRYGLEVPENEWVDNAPSFDTLAEACEAGVQAEIDNAELYAQLFDMVDNPDIIRVFTSLQRASQTKHLPAFETCAP